MEEYKETELDYLKTLEKLSTCYAVSGNEQELSEIIAELFRPFCDTVEIDKFYNVIGFKKGSDDKPKKLMITAHYDEIGMLVKSIDKAGFIKFIQVGGLDAKILLAQEVVVHGESDMIGVVGAKPPHLLKTEESNKAIKIEDLYIDLGTSADRVKELVEIGDVITIRTASSVLKGNNFSSKSLDNRASIVAMIRALQELKSVRHSSDVYFIATTQEEVGAAGAKIAAFNLTPDAAIILDTCFGEMPEGAKHGLFKLGKGPAIGVGPILHKGLSNQFLAVAKEDNFPHQIDVEPGDTGTEAWETQVSRAGIPTALISIPLRYMHTGVETVNMDDINNTGKLVARFITGFKEDVFKF